MYDYGRVTTPAAFQVWARATQLAEHRAGVLAALPPYAMTYDPTVVPQLGQDVVKVTGITGANGYYYPPSRSGDAMTVRADGRQARGPRRCRNPPTLR